MFRDFLRGSPTLLNEATRLLKNLQLHQIILTMKAHLLKMGLGLCLWGLAFALSAQKSAPIAGDAAQLIDYLRKDYSSVPLKDRPEEIARDRAKVLAIFKGYLTDEEQGELEGIDFEAKLKSLDKNLKIDSTDNLTNLIKEVEEEVDSLKEKLAKKSEEEISANLEKKISENKEKLLLLHLLKGRRSFEDDQKSRLINKKACT